ncbi:MAG: carboxypeptidase regulatory-like domain-containing protein, partial [Planctomycetia bacterium]|nr:carboxypeptidase regulatory-like domain-containing protein [Planctomycetia bacterium]
FRLSSAGGLGATGAAADGEVEDYRVTILDAGSVSGTVYTDLDKDGVLDAGEPRLAGVVITLIDENGQPVANTVTGPDGTYLFTGVPVGQYSIVETQPNGYGSSTPNILTNIQVQQNVESKDNNFGEIGGSLAGKVYFDPNNSGVQDAGEPGIIGVTVQLTGVDVNGLAVNRTTSTNLDGSYRFDGLAAGTYTITETQPAHYSDGKESLGSQGGTVGNDVFSNIALGAAVDGVNYNFGEGGRIISGTVFLDTNAPTPNGKLDTGEVGIPQVTLSLRDSLGNILAFAQTAPDGSYLFNLTALGLPAGNYTVVEIQPAGYGSSDPSNNTRNVTVPTTGLTNVNFGDTLGSIGGFVYFDQNNNGVKAANEAGIPGVTLTLTGVTSTGKAVNLTTTTGADGSYRFDGLLASNAAGYTITETQPGTYTDGKDTRGTVNGVNVGTAGNDVMTGVVLGGGQQGINYNFGERLATSKTFVSGTVFVDADNDGQLDPGEIGLAGVTVELRTTQNVLVATQTTDANGNYVFAGIAAGKYNIVETQPAGYDSTTSNTLANVNVPTTGLGNQNFGENQGSLSGFAYLDANNDGIKNDNETPLAGVVITLSGGPTSRAPVVTAADGSYHFTGLQAGNYTITETQPANVGDGKDTAGSLGGDTTVNDAISVTLGIGQQGVNYNFGERPTGLNGRVFLDLDDDGIVDPGEVGIAGVVINLTGVDNGLKLSTVTDADGFYRFPELPPGTYTISEVQPATLLDGKDVDNTGATIGAGNGDADQFVNVTAEAGVLKGPFNFAERLQPGTGFITGTVYLDRDRNQVQGGTEPGQTGVLVELLQGNTVIATTTTNPDGSYNFFNVPPGDYTTRLANDDPPSGFGASTATTSATLTVPAGGSASADFGLTLGTVSGFVYRDNNLNGVRNTGEAGIANVVLNLTGTDVNGLAVIRSVQTDENGFYRFQDLVAGNYAVAETQAQPALINFYDGDGLAVPGNLTGVVDVDLSGTLSAGDTSVGTRTQNQLSNLVLTAGAAIIEDNFGEIPPADPSGFVYHDRNNNGFKDAGEEGIAGVQIRLSGTAFAGTVLEHALTAADFILNGVELDPNLDGDNDPLTVRTDTDGHWAFEVMPPGVFALEQVTQPPDFFDGLDRDDVDVLSPTNDRFENILLAAGELRQPFNFGERRGSLSGRVFVDNNNNGVQDATELGRAGVVITLTGQTRNAAGQVVAITRFATTDANGNYTFADLPPSEAAGYRLTMTTPSNMLRGRAFPGTRGGTAITVGAKNLAIDGVNMQPGIPDLDGITNNFSLLLAGKSRFIGR